MYSHHIDEMTREIVKKLGMIDLGADILGVLKEYWSDKMAICWTVEDIVIRAKDIGKGKISDDLARRILDEVQHRHDASIGVNWTVIDDCIIDLVK
jgi:hypothetical protein